MTSATLRRELLLVVVGLLAGTGVATAAFLLIDDGDGGEGDGGGGGGGRAGAVVTTTTRARSVTRTDFGGLTDAAAEVGFRVQWSAEVASGPSAGTVEFVSAQREGELAVIWEGGRVVERSAPPSADGAPAVSVCSDDGCAASGPDEAAAVMPPPLRSFYDLLRVAAEARESPGYRITGEGDFGGGLLAQCGAYDPAGFDLDLPEGVIEVRQCLDVTTGVVVFFDLFGAEDTLGGATADAVADARPADFEVGGGGSGGSGGSG